MNLKVRLQTELEKALIEYNRAKAEGKAVIKEMGFLFFCVGGFITLFGAMLVVASWR